MAILIRPWRRNDFPAVRRILWESWLTAYKPFIPEEDLRAYFTATYHLDALSRLHDNPRVHGFIAETEGGAVGFSRTQFHPNEQRVYLASLYLLPSFQGRGIGGELLRAAEDDARAYGLGELWVGVMVKNEAARRWYDRRGFRFAREEPFRMGQTTVVHVIGCKAVGKGSDADLRRLAAVYPGEKGSPALADSANLLLDRQKLQWPGLAEGYAALKQVRVREVRCGRCVVRVQFNPRRVVSSGARLDPESIRTRPCFLCGPQLPAGQQAILYRESYRILCNPFPVFPGHLTVAHIRHLPQALPDQLERLLRLAADFGPAMVLLYNGPRSGASAPDHLHFQAIPAGQLPVERELGGPAAGAAMKRRGAAAVWCTEGLGRGAVVVAGREAGEVRDLAGAVIGTLARMGASEVEPSMNVLCTWLGEAWRLAIFPRQKHRPDAYFREGVGKLAVSPGAVEMGGVFVTYREEDFLALDARLIGEVYQEVAFDDAAVRTMVASL